MTNSTIEIKVTENPSANWELLVDGFLEYRRNDVPASGITGMHTPQGQENMTQVLKQMVQSINGPIIIAWDAKKQKVIGDLKIRFIDQEISKLEYKDQPGAYKVQNVHWDEETTQQIEHVVQFYVNQKKKLDIFCRYPDIDRHAEIFSCGVMEEYARRGIGLRLMQKALEVVRKHNCPLAYGCFSSVFSQKIAEKCGFEAVIRTRFEGDNSLYRIMPSAITEIHKDDAVMVNWL